MFRSRTKFRPYVDDSSGNPRSYVIRNAAYRDRPEIARIYIE